jgi:hypothetical protein
LENPGQSYPLGASVGGGNTATAAKRFGVTDRVTRSSMATPRSR